MSGMLGNRSKRFACRAAGAAAAVIALLLGGCGLPTTPSVPPDPMERYDPPIELTSVRTIPHPAIVSYPEGDDVHNNVWTRAILDELGIGIKYLWAVDASQFSVRQKAMIASKQLPDFFSVTNEQYRQLAADGLLADMTQDFSLYAIPEVKAVYQEEGAAILTYAEVDGRLYGIPWIAMAREAAQMLWIRTDWLEKTGKAVPSDMDALVDLAIAFATGDPDGNGIDDTLGLPVNGNSDDGLLWHRGFFNGYGAYPFAWIETAGGYLYGSVQPDMRVALERLASLYARMDGTIDREFVNKDYFSLYESIDAGRYGLVYGPYYIAISPLQGVRTRNPAADWTPVAIPSAGGTDAKVQTDVDVSGYWVVRKDCAHPAAVVKLLDFWYRKFYFNKSQQEYETFINGPDSVGIYNNSPIISYRNWFNVESFLQVRDVLDGKGREEDLGPIPLDSLRKIQAFEAGDESAWYAPKFHEAVLDVLLPYREQGRFMPDQSYFVISEASNRKFSALQTKERTLFARIIQGDATIEEFDDFVDDWNRHGGADITRDVNEWFRNQGAG